VARRLLVNSASMGVPVGLTEQIQAVAAFQARALAKAVLRIKPRQRLLDAAQR
jgi:hypothetical protein